MESIKVEPEMLKKVGVLEEVPDVQLKWLIDMSSVARYEPGEYLFRRGDPIDQMHVIIEGRFSIKIDQNGEFRQIGLVESGDITGTLPYSRASSSLGFADAVVPSVVMSLHRDLFKQMIADHHELTTALVHTMTSRVREFTRREQQDEKLLSLGKLSAGLAHELNNPASALRRTASDLREHLAMLSQKIDQLVAIPVSRKQAQHIGMLFQSKFASGIRSGMKMTQKAEQEDDIAAWLESHGLQDGYDAAAVFVDFGIQTEDLEKIAMDLAEPALVPVFEWMAEMFIAEKLAIEIGEASGRIAGLVQSIKAYTHMDRGMEFQSVNIRESIQNTLTILRHKLADSKIEIATDFPEKDIFIDGRLGALNQVWTNLIDNAVHAMESGGKLEIRAECDSGFAYVHIVDSGPGIPSEIQSKIFDPFFTTKGVNEGTGLGLDITRRIVKNHHGEISLKSRPGKTEFVVILPLRQS